jgi:hypothetical protein
MSTKNVTEFALRVAEQVTGVPLGMLETVMTVNSPGYVSSQENTETLEKDLQVYSIDPMTILAIITAIIQVMDLLKNGCGKPSQFSENARFRNQILLAIFRSRVWIAAKQAGYPRNPKQLADAMLDVAHSSGSIKVAAVVEELDSI